MLFSIHADGQLVALLAIFSAWMRVRHHIRVIRIRIRNGLIKMQQTCT